MNFNNQHALVTGGSSGIGKALALLLAARGAHVSLVARDLARMEKAAAEIRGVMPNPGRRVLVFPADVSDQARIEEAVCGIIGAQGPPDLLVTCAGMAHPGRFLELPAGVFERTMEVNYFGTLYTIRAALPSMVRRKGGRLVLISSGAGLMGIYGYTAYSPSKFALRGLAECLRGELRQSGIGISIVYPPDTDTPQLEEENRRKPRETRSITGTARMRSPEMVARKILQGVERGSFVITPGWEMTLFFHLHSILAPMAHRYFDYAAERAGRSGEQRR